MPLAGFYPQSATPKVNPACSCRQLGAIRCGVLPSELLSTHRATLERDDGARWLLRYQIKNFDFGERLASCTDIAIPIAASRFADALDLAEVILRGHVAPVATNARVAA
jgi:hypothetical protein